MTAGPSGYGSGGGAASTEPQAPADARFEQRDKGLARRPESCFGGSSMARLHHLAAISRKDDCRFVQLRKNETGIAIRAGQVKALFGARMDSDGRHRSSSSISSMCLRHWKSAQVAPTANKMARATTISTPVTGRRFCPWRRRVPGRRRPSQAPVRDLVVARARTLFIIPPMTGRRNLPAK
jgi:hypothetical protein